MISPTVLKSKLDSQNVSYVSSDFLSYHKHLEAYLKRVLLIGLRLNGLKYDDSETVIERTFVRAPNLIDKVLFLVDQSNFGQQKVISRLSKKFVDFFVLKELFLEFTSTYRNLLSHGTISDLTDPELIKLLCHVDKSFYLAFEDLLRIKHGHSAFEKPGDWGAERGTDKIIETFAESLGLGKFLDPPLTLTVVERKLANTKFPTP